MAKALQRQAPTVGDYPPGSNVVPMRLRILPRHREYLARWLDAGASMGLCDADACADGVEPDHVLVWVRENADPAYMIRPEGLRWHLIDQVRNSRLGSFPRFENALYAIRPVLSCGAEAAA
ncbi:hypothetical protein [Rhizosaccharibacter radicis]|uniref:Uncharacterized protein n=1 Tax=Rhizosaccharibacter radicis TaxID=2782605 RepID=A0ABT1VSZ3_9PROT|nr:hypothetical protein [Acetobacteraceae bacterium KSS12]